MSKICGNIDCDNTEIYSDEIVEEQDLELCPDCGEELEELDTEQEYEDKDFEDEAKEYDN